MFGAEAHATTNALLNDLAEHSKPLIVSHGGVSVGSMPPNTVLSTRAALLSGADIVKIDVSGSTDNVFYAFHDGREAELVGMDRNIQTLSAAEIGGLRYLWQDRPGRRAGVERLEHVLGTFRGRKVMFALDRSWWRWPTLLKVLDGLEMPTQLILKLPVWEAAALDKLRNHRTKYPLLAICSSLDELHMLPTDEYANLIGVELIAHDVEYPWFDPAVLRSLRSSGLLTWVNSETMNTGIDLFGGYDDERAIVESPSAAWAPILDLGVDAIQTELPWLLSDYRELRRGE